MTENEKQPESQLKRLLQLLKDSLAQYPLLASILIKGIESPVYREVILARDAVKLLEQQIFTPIEQRDISVIAEAFAALSEYLVNNESPQVVKNLWKMTRELPEKRTLDVELFDHCVNCLSKRNRLNHEYDSFICTVPCSKEPIILSFIFTEEKVIIIDRTELNSTADKIEEHRNKLHLIGVLCQNDCQHLHASQLWRGK